MITKEKINNKQNNKKKQNKQHPLSFTVPVVFILDVSVYVMLSFDRRKFIRIIGDKGFSDGELNSFSQAILNSSLHYLIPAVHENVKKNEKLDELISG